MEKVLSLSSLILDFNKRNKVVLKLPDDFSNYILDQELKTQIIFRKWRNLKSKKEL